MVLLYLWLIFSVEETNEDVTAEQAVAEVEEVANDEEEETKGKLF